MLRRSAIHLRSLKLQPQIRHRQNRAPLPPPNPVNPLIVRDAFRHQPTRHHRRGQARGRMGARADEVEVLVGRVAVAGPEAAQLGQVVAQPVRRPLHQVVTLALRQRVKRPFELDMIGHIGTPSIVMRRKTWSPGRPRARQAAPDRSSPAGCGRFAAVRELGRSPG
jgi:hypothetical protein